MVKEVFKWSGIVIMVLIVLSALRFLSKAVSGIASSLGDGGDSAPPSGPVANPSNYVNYYVPGVYGVMPPWVNPFYSSPLGSGGVNRWPRRGW